MISHSFIREGSTGTMVICRDEEDKIRIRAVLYGETLWLTQKLIAELFETTKQNISMHLKRIFDDAELAENSVVKNFFTTASDGKSYRTKHYNLDAIIAVGYRVNSKRATTFRIWATQILREYIVKGFAMDDERLRNPEYFLGKDYFSEMIERIHDIRSGERGFCQKITDIYAQCSVDYDRHADITRHFYAAVKNRWLRLMSPLQATENIDNTMPTSNDCTDPSDVTIAKTYPGNDETEPLERLVWMYLDYAENQAKKAIPMTMADWIKRFDAVLQFDEEELLLDPQGKVSKAVADSFASALSERKPAKPLSQLSRIP